MSGLRRNNTSARSQLAPGDDRYLLLQGLTATIRCTPDKVSASAQVSSPRTRGETTVAWATLEPYKRPSCLRLAATRDAPVSSVSFDRTTLPSHWLRLARRSSSYAPSPSPSPRPCAHCYTEDFFSSFHSLLRPDCCSLVLTTCPPLLSTRSLLAFPRLAHFRPCLRVTFPPWTDLFDLFDLFDILDIFDTGTARPSFIDPSPPRTAAEPLDYHPFTPGLH